MNNFIVGQIQVQKFLQVLSVDVETSEKIVAQIQPLSLSFVGDCQIEKFSYLFGGTVEEVGYIVQI